MVRAFLLIVCGALPATYSSIFAFNILMHGFVEFLSNLDLTGMVLGIWGLAAVFGMCSLWCLSLGRLALVWYIGLLFGIGATMSLGLIFPRSIFDVLLDVNIMSLADIVSLYVIFGPVLVAVYLLVELIFRTRQYATRRAAKSG